MKLLIIAATLLVTTAALAQNKVLYGNDNRKDVYEVSNALHLKLAKSTAAMINLRKLAKGAATNVYDLIGAPTLERAQNLCTSESFSEQLSAANCSGFLVGPDLLVTAGHCYKSMGTPEGACKSYAWVFDYALTSFDANPAKNIQLNNVYLCKSVVHAQLDDQHDFAIVRLDRKVVGREPLKFRTTGKIDSKASLLVIGHPSGIPTKISDGAKITLNTVPTTFSTTLDTFAGNSGSAVFNAVSGQVEGILIQGKTDYLPSIPGNPGSCQIVNKCDENGKSCTAGVEVGPVSQGEVVYRIQQIAARIKTAQAAKK